VVLASHGFKAAPEKRDIFGPHDEKVVTGGRLGRFKVRAPHRKMSELRAAIHRFRTGRVPTEDRERYLLNLTSRVAHIRQLHEGDAEKIVCLALRSDIPLKRPPARKNRPTPSNRLR